MRPLELTLDGFRSYRTAQTFEFRDRRLVGIVGEIGSGKSSVLDAIAFALFGKTPTIASNTKSLIHQLRDDCHVELRFAVGEDVWQIQRALRRRGQAGHKLVRLADDTSDAAELDPITGDDATKRRVEELLGMDFETFCRSVLLAQNRFSEFLRASAGERDKVLKGVFGFERLDQAHRVAKRRLEAVTDRLSNLAADRTRLEQAIAELATARPAAVAAGER
ncbi:MAG: SMC family ATPase, partial [Actinomycetota bacterium]